MAYLQERFVLTVVWSEGFRSRTIFQEHSFTLTFYFDFPDICHISWKRAIPLSHSRLHFFSHISIWIRWETRGTSSPGLQIEYSVQFEFKELVKTGYFSFTSNFEFIWQNSCGQGKVHRGIHAEVDEAEAGEMGQTGENLPLHISSIILGHLFITFIFPKGDLWRTTSSPGIVPRPR